MVWFGAVCVSMDAVYVVKEEYYKYKLLLAIIEKARVAPSVHCQLASAHEPPVPGPLPSPKRAKISK